MRRKMGRNNKQKENNKKALKSQPVLVKKDKKMRWRKERNKKIHKKGENIR